MMAAGTAETGGVIVAAIESIRQPVLPAPATADGRFWQSPTWDALAPCWLELVGRVRDRDDELADAIEDLLAEAVAGAIAA